MQVFNSLEELSNTISDLPDILDRTKYSVWKTIYSELITEADMAAEDLKDRRTFIQNIDELDDSDMDFHAKEIGRISYRSETGPAFRTPRRKTQIAPGFSSAFVSVTRASETISTGTGKTVLMEDTSSGSHTIAYD